MTETRVLSPDNPFAKPSTLPYELPDFQAIKTEHLAPALEAGFAERAADLEAITSNPDEPTFENTFVALERAGRLLDRVAHVFFNLCSSDLTAELEPLKAEYSAKFAEAQDALLLDGKLFARIDDVFERRGDLGLSGEDLRLVEEWHKEFVLAGAKLDDAAKARLTEINSRLATLSTQFDTNVTKDGNELAVVVDTVEELAGLSESEIDGASATARQRGLEGRYVLSLRLPQMQPALASLEHRGVRERLYLAANQRGRRDNQYNNEAIIEEIVRLRAERARLLGFDTHAAVVAADETAKTADAIVERLGELAPAAAANARAEFAELQEAANAHADELGIERFELKPWDWSFYENRVKEQRFNLDEGALMPYLEADRVMFDGVFFAANRLYGLSFKERTDLVAHNPVARVFEVFDELGSGIGLFIWDLYTREEKRGGAWMSSYMSQNRLYGDRPVVINNLNVTKPADGEPTLLTVDETRTTFHEFGHALHGLLSNVTYPRFSGTSVPRDFVEFPSQVNEMWQFWPEVVANYAKHFETGEPMPQEALDAISAMGSFGEGFATTEYLASALLDQAWHRVTPDEQLPSVAEFQAKALADVGLDVPGVNPRYSSTFFSHVFSGGYSAGYYAYIWSETLDADTVEWFKENGGLTRENGRHFAAELLSRGGSIDPLEQYRNFRGRDAVIEPLLVRRGLLKA